MICDTCKQHIDPKYGFVWHYPEKRDGTVSKRKKYEHITCSGILQHE